VILFVLGFIEMVGLGFCIDTALSSDPSACCGIISQDDDPSDSQHVAGAACSTSDITGNAINHTTLNGIVWCSVNGVICDNKTLDNSTTTLGECFDEVGFNISSVCSAKSLELQWENANITLLVMAGVLLFVLIVSTLWTIFNLFGWCDRFHACKEKLSSCCRTRKCEVRCLILNTILTILMFIALSTIGIYYVDGIIENGYGLLTGSISTVNSLITECDPGGCWDISTGGIANIVDGTCDTWVNSQTDGFVWVNYHIDVSGYLSSHVESAVSILGALLGIVELIIIITLNCCLDERLHQSDADEADDVNDQPLETESV